MGGTSALLLIVQLGVFSIRVHAHTEHGTLVSLLQCHNTMHCFLHRTVNGMLLLLLGRLGLSSSIRHALFQYRAVFLPMICTATFMTLAGSWPLALAARVSPRGRSRPGNLAGNRGGHHRCLVMLRTKRVPIGRWAPGRELSRALSQQQRLSVRQVIPQGTDIVNNFSVKPRRVRAEQSVIDCPVRHFAGQLGVQGGRKERRIVRKASIRGAQQIQQLPLKVKTAMRRGRNDLGLPPPFRNSRERRLTLAHATHFDDFCVNTGDCTQVLHSIRT